MLAFIHIPKTAGTTLHKIISHQYPRVVIRHDSDGPLTPETASDIASSSPQVVMGHMSVGLHQFIPGVRYVTCLRDPISRLISHYHHALHDPAHYLHDPVHSRKLGLADYVSSGLSGELSNGMTRMVAGIEDFHHGAVNDQTLALAKANIEILFDGVILSEMFDPGILLLAEHLNWKVPYYLRRKVGHYGAAIRKPDLKTRGTLEEMNRFDCELHAWATQRFSKTSSSFPELPALTRQFQKDNHSKGKAIFCFRELRLRLGMR